MAIEHKVQLHKLLIRIKSINGKLHKKKYEFNDKKERKKIISLDFA